MTDRVLFDDIASKDFLGFDFGSRSYASRITAAVAKTGAACAVRCTLRSLPDCGDVVWLAHNFAFLGGSLGCAEGEVLCRGFEYGREHGLPVVVECKSGGARMQEGTLSLMQLGKARLAALHCTATARSLITAECSVVS